MKICSFEDHIASMPLLNSATIAQQQPWVLREQRCAAPSHRKVTETNVAQSE